MRILHVVPSYLPARRYGGPIWSVHGLAKALVRRGHEVHVFTTDRDGPGRLNVRIGEPVDVDGVKVWYFASHTLKRLFWAPGLKHAAARDVATFDVVHLHSVYLWPTAVAAAMARRHGVPYVLAPRGMLVKELIERKSALLKRAWIRLVERRNLAAAAAVHFTSTLEEAEARKLRLELRSAVIVPNGVDVEDLVADGARDVAGAGETASGGHTLLYIGRLSWKKGLERLIGAVEQLPDCRLVIAGNDDEGYRSRLEALAEERGVRSRLEFTGPVYGAAKAELFRRAAAFVLPSYNENFGNVVIEAMAAGCPVVVTRDVGAADLVVRWRAGIVAEGEPTKLAAAIAALLSDPMQLREMGENGRRAVSSNYTWDAVAEQMLAVYRGITLQEQGALPAGVR